MKGGKKYSLLPTYKDAFLLLFLVIKVYHSLVYFNLRFCELVPITGNVSSKL